MELALGRSRCSYYVVHKRLWVYTVRRVVEPTRRGVGLERKARRPPQWRRVRGCGMAMPPIGKYHFSHPFSLCVALRQSVSLPLFLARSTPSLAAKRRKLGPHKVTPVQIPCHLPPLLPTTHTPSPPYITPPPAGCKMYTPLRYPALHCAPVGLHPHTYTTFCCQRLRLLSSHYGAMCAFSTQAWVCSVLFLRPPLSPPPLCTRTVSFASFSVPLGPQ